MTMHINHEGNNSFFSSKSPFSCDSFFEIDVFFYSASIILDFLIFPKKFKFHQLGLMAWYLKCSFSIIYSLLGSFNQYCQTTKASIIAFLLVYCDTIIPFFCNEYVFPKWAWNVHFRLDTDTSIPSDHFLAVAFIFYQL